MSATRWYAVHTRPAAEAKAALELARQGYRVYLPRYLKRRRHARRTDTVAAALFPRYLFVAVDARSQRWRTINSTRGVARLVCNGDLPAMVDGALVDELRRGEDPQGYIRLAARPSFARGDAVRVLDGLFSSALAIFDGMTDGERVAVLLDFLGRKARVVMDAELIAAA